GCEIVRLAVKDSQDARAFKKIRRSTRFPLVADIHFNWRLAIEAIDNGADKIRLNPGNIYKKEEIKNIVSALKQAKIPLRVGVNSGSVRDLNSARSSLADRLVKGALDYVKIIEDMNFYNIVISLKASSVLDTIEAYRKISKICDYPMHLGLTATGFPFQGAIKSSIAIGVLLLEGIGDTIRVSLTDQPVHEVRAAQSILESLGLRHFGPQIISCPTCGRCQVDLVKLVGDFEKKLTTYHLPLTTKSFKIAIMGCEVNGPGEAREADIGIAFGKKTGVLFRKGEIEKKVSYANSLGYLLNELKKRR
ncbi:MAG: flavodoxin-dependent (E)-4-hydroxy-3-methylbut-2-enyl-diphosphate synthase, partial [Candidatus Omnitrophica bacterium]|nr:flavodoxin-dependent (E)-4-hydroxy-3-methylbut-2-enyl-diphosphate synthase [Candidatus Omnitrophota bacterium]